MSNYLIKWMSSSFTTSFNYVITWSRFHSDNESTRSIIFEYKNSSFLTIFNDSLDKSHGAKDSILSINDQGYDGECIWIDSP